MSTPLRPEPVPSPQHEPAASTHRVVRRACAARGPPDGLRRLGDAAALRLADRGAPPRAPRRRHVRRVAHARARSARAGGAPVPAAAAGERRGQARASPERRSTPACCARTAASWTTSSSISWRRTGSGWWSTPALRTRTWPGSWRSATALAPALVVRAAARSRHDRGAGAAGARAASGRRDRRRGRTARRSPCSRCAGRRAVRRAHRLHRRGRIRDHAAGSAGRVDCGATCSPPALRRADWVPATRCGWRRA